MYLWTGPCSGLDITSRLDFARSGDSALVLGTNTRIYAVAIREVMLRRLMSLT